VGRPGRLAAAFLAGVPDLELCLQDTFFELGDGPAALNERQEHFRRLLSHFQRGLYDGGEGGIEDIRGGGVGEAYQGYSAGNGYLHGPQLTERRSAQSVAGCKDGVGFFGQLKELGQRLVCLFPDHAPMQTEFYISLIYGTAGVQQGLFVSCQSLGCNGKAV